MKPSLLDESKITILIIVTLIHFGSPNPSTKDEEVKLRTRRSENGDADVGESRSHFASFALPPIHRSRHDRHPEPSERSWRFIQGPRFVPHSEGQKPPRRFNPAQPNFHVSSYPNHPREQVRYAPVPQRGNANREFNDAYIREYPHDHQQQRFVEQKTIQRPPQVVLNNRPQVQDFLAYRDPPTRLQAPEEVHPLRHYNIGHQLPDEEISNYPERERNKENNSRHGTSSNGNNEPRPGLPYYQDYVNEDYYEKAYEEVSTESTPSLLHDRDTSGDLKDPDRSIFPTSVSREHDKESLLKTEDHRPKNLASLLAGTTGSKNIEKTKENPFSTNSQERRTKSRTTIPEHLKPVNADEYYYDDLYDEFVDMYFDEGNETKNSTVEPASIPKATEEAFVEDKRKNWRESSSVSSSSHSDVEEIPTTPLTLEKENISPLNPNLAKKLTTLIKSTLSAAVTKAPRDSSNPPISLSEIIQELGLNLPQFLGTLKTHGTSLKDFTDNLQTKSLSKSEFRRAKGSVKKLLEILEGKPEKDGSNNSPNVKEDRRTTTKITTTTFKSTSSSASGILVSTTTQKSTVTSKSSRPLIFGTGSSGVHLVNSKTKNISKGDEEPTEDVTTKRPISIEVDISHIANEKGISSADIFQDFGKMFNISDTKSSTLAPQLEKITTISIRPNQKTTEKLHPYRPFDFENRGNPNIHRGIINSRLSSTARPTLRPPYSPRPPSINFGDTGEEIRVAFVPHQEETVNTKDNISNNDSRSNKKKKYDEYNYKTVKTSPENLDVSTRSAIMAAGILGGVALSVFIAIFIVVKYKNHVHRNRRRIPLTLPSDASSSSLPPIYASRNVFGKEAYETSGFWTTLKKRFDPYSTSSSPTSM